ncbi:hypothetical protein EDC01DRAFT_777617 [Geopyxis carbonaria]|nr:hypothetical protein EDC01DRAFT_777617 [Geopyxis carbonaria]
MPVRGSSSNPKQEVFKTTVSDMTPLKKTKFFNIKFPLDKSELSNLKIPLIKVTPPSPTSTDRRSFVTACSSFSIPNDSFKTTKSDPVGLDVESSLNYVSSNANESHESHGHATENLADCDANNPISIDFAYPDGTLVSPTDITLLIGAAEEEMLLPAAHLNENSVQASGKLGGNTQENDFHRINGINMEQAKKNASYGDQVELRELDFNRDLEACIPSSINGRTTAGVNTINNANTNTHSGSLGCNAGSDCNRYGSARINTAAVSGSNPTSTRQHLQKMAWGFVAFVFSCILIAIIWIVISTVKNREDFGVRGPRNH